MIVNDTFLDRVAHDLRGELSTMLAGVHYLQRFGRESSAPSRDMLDRVSDAGDRLARLLEEFDDAIWLLDKPKPLVLEPTRMRTIVHDLLEKAGKLGAFRTVPFRIELVGDETREFVADAEMLTRALLYIADFAMLRCPGSEVRAIAGFVDDLPVVRIIDDGMHVPERVRDRLFEPFVENELVTLVPPGRRKVRLGLGLAIARAIFDAHGGSVDIEASDPSTSSGLVFRCHVAR